ncbi:methyl-accepting chemotaxis protein [Photobacterium sp. 2_MG-2023]|uniref:methyl-accepting chemotaxis protein n=1 Tax=Photobacterium sp. 2_MG-2023 TaxID=3062663 RepID=UPI0026E1A48D|nr:methyl-accepting chemotaxis protein [Photobacterium sp. 2_MG-2023]MDO6582269.1 methyl-accepting chemotaxis protein [Photobacterium sp. 2_MG-2023]
MKKFIVMVVCAMFAIAAIASIWSTSYISHQEIDSIILKKSQVQAELLAKNVEYVLENSQQPEDDLQALVLSLKQRSDISYAVVINKHITAIAHSDPQKLNKVYDDSYTVEGAGQGKPKHSKWYADVQKVWVYDIMMPVHVNGSLYGAFDVGIPITEVDNAASEIVIAQLTAIIIIFIICAAFLMWILNRLFMPLTGLQQALEDISKGDGNLTVRLPVKGNDEIARISEAFNIFVSKINDIIVQVVDTGVGLGRSAASLRDQSVHALSRGQDQSEQTLLVVTSMNEMIATINEISNNAAGAAESAGSANSETQAGRKTLQAATNTINHLAGEMNDMSAVIATLADKTQSIGSILDVIRGISEQTNLLALNAAIEAARAGEAGRGFAVVADEVRNLATKTAQSTDEIQRMIDQLQHEAKNAVTAMESSKSLTEEGTKATEDALSALDEISGQVVAILDMNTQVATATEQQSSVANEINLNMDTVNQAVQAGLDASMELEKTSQDLAGLAEKLDRLVGAFKLARQVR